MSILRHNCMDTWAPGRQWGPWGQDKWLGLERPDCSSPSQRQLSSIWTAPAFPRGSSLSYNCPEIEFGRPAAAHNRKHRNNISHTVWGLLFLDKSPGRSGPRCTQCGVLSTQGKVLQIPSTGLVRGDHLMIKSDFTLEAPARAETPETRAGHVCRWLQDLALKNSGTSLAERRDGTDPLPPMLLSQTPRYLGWGGRNTPLTSSSWTAFPSVQNYLKAQPEGTSTFPIPLGRASPRPAGRVASSPAGPEPQDNTQPELWASTFPRRAWLSPPSTAPRTPCQRHLQSQEVKITVRLAVHTDAAGIARTMSINNRSIKRGIKPHVSGTKLL